MEIRASGYDRLVGIESQLKYFDNTSFKLYDLGDLHRRLSTQPIHLIIQKLKESGLIETTFFPMAMQAPDLVRECIKRYNPKTRQIFFPDQSVLLSMDKELMQSTFDVPLREKYCDIDFASFASMFNEKKTQRREDMQRTWFETTHSKKSKMPKTLFGTNLKKEIVHILELL